MHRPIKNDIETLTRKWFRKFVVDRRPPDNGFFALPHATQVAFTTSLLPSIDTI